MLGLADMRSGIAPSEYQVADLPQLPELVPKAAWTQQTPAPF